MTTTAPLDALVIRRATRDDLEAIVRVASDLRARGIGRGSSSGRSHVQPSAVDAWCS